jgi:uncharacterized membrane protein YeaQ/YmgE (transglycosylase-associated protein family)
VWDLAAEVTEDKAGFAAFSVGGFVGRCIGGWLADFLGVSGLEHLISETIGGAALGWLALRLYRWLRR